uniref:Nucleolar protein 6 n=1 Tax=Setaria digitata TaxID=48799 RepID=A0A915PV07_9BILA
MKRKLDDGLEQIDRKREKRRLICMQIDDYIEDIRLSDGERCKLEELAESVKRAIYAAKEAKNAHQMSDLRKLHSDKIRFPLSLPFGLELSKIKSSCDCRWVHPVKVDILGNWRTGYQTKKEPILDLIVIIPQNYFGSRDYLNFTYFVKRAHYICQVARILVKTGFRVKFGLDRSDPLRPLLFVSNGDVFGTDGFLRVHFAPPREFTKISRFRPENNNLRPSFCSAHFASVGIDTPTPVYNSKILIDMLREEIESRHEVFFGERPAYLKALILIRSWMLQRGFIQRVDGFSDLLLEAWLVFIDRQESSFAQASAFDIIIAFFSSVISTDWKKSHLGLCDNDALYQQFSSNFDFVFLDYTGYLNLATFLSTTAMEQIRAAATVAITKINVFAEFDDLFVKIHPFTSSFDQYIRIRLPQLYLESTIQKPYSAECVSTCNDLLLIFKRKLGPVLEEALSDRIVNFDFVTPNQQDELWDVCAEREEHITNELALLIGLRLSSKWNSSLTRGPPAKSGDAIHFRQFWGDICELRKFPDNAICEAVVWGSTNVTQSICQHILLRHFKLEACYVEERMLDIGKILPSVMDRYSTITRAYDKLCQTLRMLNDLPLIITNIHPISAYLRRTAPFQPLSTNAVVERSNVFVKDCVALPLPHVSPPYLPTVEVQITMEHSGKWGEELGAIARLKTAFYIELSKILKDKHSISAVPFDDYLIIHFNTVVFRLVIAYPKEVQIMRKLNSGKTGIPKDSPASRLKELEVVLTPQLAAFLHSTSQRFEAFPDTCRLAMYWLSSHALSDYLNEMILETIVASVFLKPFSVQPPSSPFIAFLHFLTLLSTHNWLMKPLLVDFDNEWTEEDAEEMEKEFIKMRPVLPVMVICTSVDRTGYRWTREEPQPLIMKRLIGLANASAVLLERHISGSVPLNLKGVFTTEVSTFCDVIIHIKGRHLVRRRVVRRNVIKGPLPVVDYDPVREYVKRLRQCFSSVALFFYNKYVGDVIGVVWKPAAMVPRDASVSSCLHRLKGPNNQLNVNVGAILDDFTILGYGIVRDRKKLCMCVNSGSLDNREMENLDDLALLLAGSSVTVAPNSTSREHPRFSQYKYVGRAEVSQERRRQEFLRRQKEARFDYANHARKLAMNELDECDEKNGDGEEMDSEMSNADSKMKNRKRNWNRYADELMLSEWLVDIPERLSKDWICLPCPVGRRCLVVASNGVTSAYSKSGYLITQFHSYLPGGNHPCRGTYTLLDCVFDAKSPTFYCLDMIAWNSLTVADSDFDCRLFMMNSRITENENFKEVSKQIPYRFICLPYCRCENSSMEEMMKQNFDFELDGVLFYHASVHYLKGQSPLVGWLKPWMMPEILSVPVPEKLMNGNEIKAGSSQKFIETYNQKHNHCSCHLKNGRHLCFAHEDLHTKVRELENVAEQLESKIKNLKNSRYAIQQENEQLIQQSNQKILADKRLLENAQQVKMIGKQIEYTNRLIKHKRKTVTIWQNGTVQKVYKENEIKMLEQENIHMERKMTDWLKLNQRLLGIFEMMKDREIEMTFTAERCLQRNIQARDDCSMMQTRILTLSKMLDENSLCISTNGSSSSITFSSQDNKLRKWRPVFDTSHLSQTVSTIERARNDDSLEEQKLNTKQMKTVAVTETENNDEEEQILELLVKRCNFGLFNCANFDYNTKNC